MIYDAFGVKVGLEKVELVGADKPVVVATAKEEVAVKSENERLLEELQWMTAELDRLKAKEVEKGQEVKGAEFSAMDAFYPETENISRAKGAKRSIRPSATRLYLLLSDVLRGGGRIPQQQMDLAAIIVKRFKVGETFSEVELFRTLDAEAVKYPQLVNSTMGATYLFAYYRGLDKRDGKHMGYIRRNFLRIVQQ